MHVIIIRICTHIHTVPVLHIKRQGKVLAMYAHSVLEYNHEVKYGLCNK